MKSSASGESYFVSLAAGVTAVLVGLLSVLDLLHALHRQHPGRSLRRRRVRGGGARAGVGHPSGARGMGPRPDPEAPGEVVRLLWLPFLGVPVGVAIGRRLANRACPPWAVATLVAHFSLGGSIALDGGRGAVLGLFFWLLPTHLIAGITLVWTHALFAKDNAVRGKVSWPRS